MTEFSECQRAAIAATVAAWPLDKSVMRASEELMELALAMLHYQRGKGDIDAVLNEMADVRIALEHLEVLFGGYQDQLDSKVWKGNLNPIEETGGGQ